MRAGERLWVAARVAAAGGLVRGASGQRSPDPPGEFRLLDGERIHVVDAGSGPPVVLVHGFGGSTFSWRYTIAALAGTHRVIALDLPGFGFSDRSPRLPLGQSWHARRVARLIDDLGTGPATIVGHSMGGAIAERLASEFPGHVERLVLVAAVDASRPTPDFGGRRGSMLLGAAGAVARCPWVLRLLAGRALARMTAEPGLVTAEMVDGYSRPLGIPGTAGCLRRMARDSSAEGPADLGKIRALTLVLSGERDRVVPAATGERVAAAIPGASHVVLAGTGHLPAEEQPEAFTAELRRFLCESRGRE